VVADESAVQAAVAVPPVVHGVIPVLHERVVGESTGSPAALIQLKTIMGIAPKPAGVVVNCLQVSSTAPAVVRQAVEAATGPVPWVDPPDALVPIQQFKVAPSLRKLHAKTTKNPLLIAENIFV
jgi:hypothetical protein